MQTLTPAFYPGPPVRYVQPVPATISSLVKLPPVHGTESVCFPSPFSPVGGAAEWQSNELLLKDNCMRKTALVCPLDADINALYYVNPVPKL